MENNTEILTKINSGDALLIAEAVQAIQENGDLNIAESLLNQLESIKDSHIITIVSNLLADIKETKFRELLIQRLQNATDTNTKSALLRIVWESSLDYSPYLEIFIHLLQEEDFAVAFEASTVIENMVHNLSDKQFEQLHELIHQFPKEKAFLIENIHEEMNCKEE